MPNLSISTFSILLSLLHSTLFLITTLASTDTFIYSGCSQMKYTPNSQYETDVNSLLTSVVNSAMSTPFNKFTTGSTSASTILSGLYQCRGDMSQSDCSTCVQHALSQLGVLCPASCGGVIQLEGCFIKYDNATFLGVEDKTMVAKKCGSAVGYNSDELVRREQVLGYLMSGGRGLYRDGSAGGVRAVAQCVGDLSVSQCQDCLGYAVQRLRNDCGPVGSGDVFLAKCYVRVFVGGSHSDSAHGTQDDEIEKTLAILIGLIAGVALLIIFLAFLRKLCDGKDFK